MKFSLWLEQRMFDPNRNWKHRKKTSGLMGSVNRTHRLKAQEIKTRKSELDVKEKENEL
jgi:hypothetical protein